MKIHAKNMKKLFLIAVSVVCAAVICSSYFVSANGKTNQIEVSPVSVKSEVSVSDNLLSMLNHNYVYGVDFDNADSVVNLSLNALIGLKTDDGYIKESAVKDFVYNMYGIDVVDFSKLNAEYPQRDDYVFVVPSGFTEYEHSNISLKTNEDGTITAETNVKVMSHDGLCEEYVATSLFVKNNASCFGYNIVYSEMISIGTSI